MEAKQTAQMVTWLDEERRKDKALISKLEERTASQAAIIEEQARRIQRLETEIVSVRNSLFPSSLIDEAVSRVRVEFLAATEQLSARREQTEQELKRLRDTDREAILRTVEELRQEYIARLERELQVRRQEEERLSRIAVELQAYATNLSRGLEEFERSLTFLEEQRRQDSRRISDISGEIVEMAKRIEAQKPKVELIEELTRRNERNITQLSSELVDFKQQRQAWMEQEALAAHHREQVLEDMLRRMNAFAETIEGHGKQVVGWADMHRTMKKQIEDFDRIADRADRRLNEVAEVQRLSEERFRQEWEEWLQDDQKRWRQFTLTNEEARREQIKSMEDLQGRMVGVVEQVVVFKDHIKRLRSNQQDVMRNLTNAVQTLRDQVDDVTGLPPLP